MKSLPALLVLAGLAVSLACTSPAGAQQGFAQTERNAVGLKQGMSAEEVQKLLGTPRRTARKTGGAATVAAEQGTLPWAYAWTNPSHTTLRIEFAAKAPAQWFVTNWDWSTY